MPSLLRIIVVIPVGFIAACLGAAAMLVVAAGGGPIPGEDLSDYIPKVLVLSWIASFFVGAVAAVPALILIIPAEAFGLRSLVLYLVLGAGIGLAAFLIGIGNAQPPDDLPDGAAAGAIGGLIYWLIAGRRAGLPAD